MSKKDLALQQALDQITSSFGKGSIMWLGRSVTPRHVPVVSTGSFALDIALGTGGLPKVHCNFLGLCKSCKVCVNQQAIIILKFGIISC